MFDPADLDALALPELPLFLRVARLVIVRIREGRLQAGELLPGTRTLSERLGVGRNSITAAYDELMAEGWIVPDPGVGMRIADPLPREAAAGASPARQGPSYGFDLPSRLPALNDSASRLGPGVLDLREALPDPRLLPKEELARALRRVLKGHPRKVSAELQARGLPELREALCAHLAEFRGLRTEPSRLLVVQGEAQALDLVARAFLKPGTAVAVESPGDPKAWEVLRLQGAELLPVPVDGEGLRPEALASLLEARPVRLLLTTPRAQVPTTAVLSESRRRALLELAARHRLAILEWDAAAELHYDEEAPRPLAAEDPHGVVIHLGSFQRLLDPSLGLAFLVGSNSLLDRLAALQSAAAEGASPVLQWAVRELLLDDTLARFARKARAEYRIRREAMDSGLRQHFAAHFRWRLPASGLAFWLESPSGLTWMQAAKHQGLLLQPGRAVELEHLELRAFPLPFAALDPREISALLERLAGAIR